MYRPYRLYAIDGLPTHLSLNPTLTVAAVEEQGELRVELIDGEICMAPAPVPMHQIIVGNLMLLLGTHVRLKRLGVVLTAPLDVELKPGADTVQPDLVFIRQERLAELLGARQIKGAPD